MSVGSKLDFLPFCNVFLTYEAAGLEMVRSFHVGFAGVDDHLLDSLHLGEALSGLGVVDPEVLCSGFQLAAADDLDSCPSIALEGRFFEVGVGLANFAEF